MSDSTIVRLGAGNINGISDTYIGTTGVPGGPTRSHFAGQLGKAFWLDDDNIIYDSAVGVVYGGWFQYVRLAASAVQPVRGQILFHDPNVAPNLFQVTTDITVSTPSATLIAGINLNPSWTLGDYGVIQLFGICYVKNRATLTTAGAVGCPVYAATAGGAAVGLADVLTTDATAAINATFLGKAYDIPVGGTTTRVYLQLPVRNG